MRRGYLTSPGEESDLISGRRTAAPERDKLSLALIFTFR
ncbi:hypothetical protein DE4576_00366 [Mycobacterium marinum]|nr:hypothetical protein DE4576_00366 [Mycobacterium marinum]